jgi:hypothetical protein
MSQAAVRAMDTDESPTREPTDGQADRASKA